MDYTSGYANRRRTSDILDSRLLLGSQIEPSFIAYVVEQPSRIARTLCQYRFHSGSQFTEVRHSRKNAMSSRIAQRSNWLNTVGEDSLSRCVQHSSKMHNKVPESRNSTSHIVIGIAARAVFGGENRLQPRIQRRLQCHEFLHFLLKGLAQSLVAKLCLVT